MVIEEYPLISQPSPTPLSPLSKRSRVSPGRLKLKHNKISAKVTADVSIMDLVPRRLAPKPPIEPEKKVEFSQTPPISSDSQSISNTLTPLLGSLASSQVDVMPLSFSHSQTCGSVSESIKASQYSTPTKHSGVPNYSLNSPTSSSGRSVKNVFGQFMNSVTEILGSQKKSEISSPFDPVHLTHVDFDTKTRKFTGLPKEWQRILAENGISQKEQEENPQAIMDILAFYTDTAYSPILESVNDDSREISRNSDPFSFDTFKTSSVLPPLSFLSKKDKTSQGTLSCDSKQKVLKESKKSDNLLPLFSKQFSFKKIKSSSPIVLKKSALTPNCKKQDMSPSKISDSLESSISSESLFSSNNLISKSLQNVKDSSESYGTKETSDSGKMAMLLYKHFKKTPGTHKLGVLYVLDSVARAYQDLSRGDKGDKEVSEEGTFAGGLQQLTQLLESLMNDMMLYAPAEHREKVLKLVNIWEKAETFPIGLLLRLRTTHFSESLQTQQVPQSGSGDGLKMHSVEPVAAAASSGSMNTVADQTELVANQTGKLASSSSALTDTDAPAAPVISTVLQALALMAQQMKGEQQTVQNNAGMSGSFSRTLGGSDGSVNTFSSADNIGSQSLNSGVVSLSTDPMVSSVGQIPPVQQPLDTLHAQQMALLQLLTQKGVSAAQIQSIIQHVQSSSGALPTPNDSQATLDNTYPALQTFDNIQRATNMPSTLQHSANALQSPLIAQHSLAHVQHTGMSSQRPVGVRSSQGGVSEGIQTGSLVDLQTSRPRLSSKRKDSKESFSRPLRSSEDRGKLKSASRQSDERSLSPPLTRIYSTSSTSRSSCVNSYDSPSVDNASSFEPSYVSSQQPNSLKCYVRDPSVSEDSIKVLSRTLFIGGVSQSISQEDLLRMFSPYGDIQSCIVNHTARHAFIKMYRRKDAEAARSGMETFTHEDTVIRTKWGVGFGPRDCSNYTTGVSIIPIWRLTEVDRRWCMFAEWGGTGGRPLEGGFVMEEPDIEIGTAVGSKAANKRQLSGRNEHKKGPASQKQQQQFSQQSPQLSQQHPQLQENSCFSVENVSRPSSTLVSPWLGAIQAHSAYKTTR
ncbi:hypothetical protein PORY_002224 [Pneumocystis oryctolagi]|uniref:Uncharacterized protein n=1 Tax=Pneumocystis oryctolagi TaxID=42067 RepID=A0ACB7CCE3_9ASCO|nr:hypothetical protein PORY_002224 [Pneumocystis oryctolagi]